MKRSWILLTLGYFLSLQGLSATTFTTEFQARVTGNDDISNALEKMGVNDVSACSVVSYKLYDDKNGTLQKNDIAVRYRDKGKKADLCIKFKLKYSQETVDLLSTYFTNDEIKKEINRYYNFGEYIDESGQVELTFRTQVSKKDLGLDKTDSLSNEQILGMFLDVVQQIKDNYPTDNSNNVVLESIKEKMDLFVEKDFSNVQIIVRSFNRNSCEVKDWNGYEKVTVEYSDTQYTSPFLEISTRMDGDTNNNDFFDKLKNIGVYKDIASR